MGFGPASVDIETERDGDRARLVPAGSFDLSHAATVTGLLERVQPAVDGCQSVELDLAKLARLDGTGAVLLARLLDRLEAMGHRTQIVDVGNRQAGRLIALYRERRSDRPPADRRVSTLAQLGGLVNQVPRAAGAVLDFLGRFAAALPKAIAAPRSVNWGSLPALLQEVGAGSLVVTGAANLLVGVIIAFLGISQLGRFGAVSFVPELVIVAQFRELGPLVTAIVVAGRSGAGFASEIATMKVSEEVDALRSMGFDPMQWLVLPRCLALVVAVPLLTWIGDALAVFGGFLATTAITNIPPRAYLIGTGEAITATHFFTGLIKTPFLALAIALIACGHGLTASGGAAGVGARTTSAVVRSIFSVIVINSLFTFFFVFMGI
jgi:phospholipid/cholesterol/gamma-HCH transport system permease protein